MPEVPQPHDASGLRQSVSMALGPESMLAASSSSQAFFKSQSLQILQAWKLTQLGWKAWLQLPALASQLRLS